MTKPPAKPTDPPQPPAPTPDPPAGQLTQADLDKAAAAAAAKAKKDAEQALADWLDNQKAAADLAAMSEADRATAAAAAATAAADALKAEAAHERLLARIERRLTAAGVPAEGVTDVAGLVKVDDDADDDTLTAAVDDLKSRLPGLFTAAAGDPTKPPPAPPSDTNPKPPPGGPPPKTGLDRGRERARSARPARPEGDPFAALQSA